MSNSSQPEERKRARQQLRPPNFSRRWPFLAGLSLVVAGVGGLGWRAWIYVHNDLSPEIARRVETILQRPVDLGEVERVSLTSIRFGPSGIPAQTGDTGSLTAIDRDSASVAAIEVGFNLWEILVNRKLNLDLTFEQPMLQVFQEADGAWLNTNIQPLETPGDLETQLIKIRLKDAQAILIPYQKSPIRITNVNGQAQVAQLLTQPNINLNLDGSLPSQGRWRLRGSWDSKVETGDVNLQAENVALTSLNGLLPAEMKIQQGKVSLNLATNLPLPPEGLPNTQGWVKLQNLAISAKNISQPLSQVNGELQFQGQTARLQNLRGKLGSIPWQASGTINSQAGLNLQAKVEPLDLNQTAKDWKLKLPVAVSGKVQIPKIQILGTLANPTVQGELRNQGPVKIDQIALRNIQAPFRANLQQFQLTDLRVMPQAGGELRGQARVAASGEITADLRLNQVPAAPIAKAYGLQSEIPLGRVSARVSAQGSWRNPNSLAAKVDFQAPEAAYPTYGTAFVTQQGILMPILTTQLVGGVVTGQGQVRDNTWQLTLNTAGIPLRPFNPNFSGLLQAKAQLSGVVNQFSAATTQATVTAELLDSPLGERATAKLAWNGTQIQVQQATAAGMTAQGIINANLTDTPKITGMNLQVAGNNIQLSQLARLGLVQTQLQDFPVDVNLVGQANLNGQLTGTLETLRFQANLSTRNLAVNQIPFAPGMNGQLRYESQRGLDFALAGGTDRLNITLNPDWLPNSFLVQRQQAQATGQRQGSTLNVSLARFPLELLNIRLLPQPSLISGEASGQMQVNLNQFNLAGGLTVARPGIANWIGDQLTANFSYSNGQAQIRQGQLRRGNSTYNLQAQISNLFRRPSLAGQLAVVNGELADIVDLATILGLTDTAAPEFSNAAALGPITAGDAQAPLLVQLRRLAELQTLQSQVADQPPPPVPQLEDLSGQFNANLNLVASASQGWNVKFDVEGEDWQWGQYPINRFTSNGQIINQEVSLKTLELQSQGGVITAMGRLSPQLNQASVRIQNFPLTTLRSLVALPNVDLTGNLNATATLSGSPKQPQVRGQLTLEQAKLNDTPIEAAAASFTYNQGRANFNGQANINSPDPLLIAGSIPYQLPWVTTPITDNQLNVTVQVKDQGLALLNAFTDQLNWVDGQGEVNVLVRGTLDEPIVRGQIQLENAEFTSPSLAGPLTNVSGEIRFNDDRLQVMGLEGLFNQGQVQLTGVLPLVNRFSLADPDRANPLTLEVRQVQVRARDIFTGEVNGSIRFTDSLRSPDIGGLVQLSQGRFVLTDALAGANGQAELANNLNGALDPIAFNDLEIQLGNNFQILRAPVLNFIGQGSITLNGQVDNLQPRGEVRLTQGRLNLFTSLFRLVPDQPNLVTFSPSDGLDPLLNLTLQTTVQEVSNPGSINLGELGASNNLTTLGSLTPVRIRAQIQGRASQLQNNFNGIVQLSSTPGRSNNEILALLGGGFNPNNQAANELALVNIASAAVFNNIQANIDDFLSNRTTFRLFPALVPPTSNRDGRNDTAVLALGAEIGYAVTDNLTLSAVQLLTVPQDPTRLNVGYQLTDRIRLSTQLGLDGQSVGLIEFRTRF